MSARRWLPAAVLAAAVAGAGLLAASRPRLEATAPESRPPEVRVVTAAPSRVRLDVRSQGVVEPRDEIDLVAEVAGKVVRLHPGFAVGGGFRAGEVLLAVDERDYRVALLQAEARLAEARRVLAQEQAAAAQAGQEWQVLGEGRPTPLALHEPQLAEARAKLRSAEAELADARLRLARCELRAPFAGRVKEKRAGIGQALAAGEKVARIYGVEFAEVRLPLAPDQLAFLDLPPARPGKAWNGPAVSLGGGDGTPQRSGRIVRREGLVDPATGLEYLVAQLEDPFGWRQGQPPLNPGSFVHALIEGRMQDGIYALPPEVLDASHNALLVDRDGRLDIRRLEVLRSEPERVLVRSGLQPGDRVVAGGIELPVAGMRVTVAAEDAAPPPPASAAR